jgi:hypothetical protein
MPCNALHVYVWECPILVDRYLVVHLVDPRLASIRVGPGV